MLSVSWDHETKPIHCWLRGLWARFICALRIQNNIRVLPGTSKSVAQPVSRKSISFPVDKSQRRRRNNDMSKHPFNRMLSQGQHNCYRVPTNFCPSQVLVCLCRLETVGDNRSMMLRGYTLLDEKHDNIMVLEQLRS